MKFLFLLVLLLALFGVAPAFAGEPLKAVSFVCSNDPDQERQFLGISEVMEDQARRQANQKCDDETGGVAIHIIYIYKDDSQKEG